MTTVVTADEAYIQHVHETAEMVADGIKSDIQYQTGKFGAQRLTSAGWFLVIVEEAGEVAQAYMKGQLDEAIAEAQQTIACYSRLITELQREQQNLHVEEAAFYRQPE